MSSVNRTPQPGRRPRSRASRRVRRNRLILGIATLAIVFLAVIGGIIALICAKSPTARDAMGTIVSRNYTPDRAFPHQDEVNLLLMGRDLDRDRHGRILKTRGRTDTMMLAHIDFKDHSASILSIPRDTLVRIPGRRGKRRVSYANAYGGPELAMDTIERFTGVRPDHYLLINFEGFEKAIDAIGGLEINVDKKLDYDDNWGNLHIHLKPGKQLLDGKQAIGFVRFRHSNTGVGDSDLVRISRQQEFLRATKAKLSSANVVFKVPRVLDIIRNDIKGDLTPAQMVCLARFVKSLPAGSGMKMVTIPTIEGGGVFVRADVDATRKLVRQMFLDNQQ